MGLPCALIYVVTGPTGSGKSRWAVKQALQHNGEIINADSQQLYAGLPLLTAQPSHEERQTVPHHLYGLFTPQKGGVSVGLWHSLAINSIKDVLRRGKTPWIVGGTGFYLNALLKGLSPTPYLSPDFQQTFRAQVAHHPTSLLFKELESVDPFLSRVLHPTDRQRITRALAVFKKTKKPLSLWQQQKKISLPYRFHITLFDLPPSTLRGRIHGRLCSLSFSHLLDEVSTFCKRNSHSKDCSAIGFQQLRNYLLSPEESQGISATLAAIEEKTRQYAKRQRTWFRHQIEADLTIHTENHKVKSS